MHHQQYLQFIFRAFPNALLRVSSTPPPHYDVPKSIAAHPRFNRLLSARLHEPGLLLLSAVYVHNFASASPSLTPILPFHQRLLSFLQ